MSTRKGIPEGASNLIPRLFCRDIAAESEFCVKVFDAQERLRRPGPDGTPAHAMLTIGPAMLMLEAEWPEMTSRVPARDGSSAVVLYIYVEDVDLAVERALAAGAILLRPVADQFWGDRMGWIMDPEGHVWTVASRIEETTEEERSTRWSGILSKEEEAK